MRSARFARGAFGLASGLVAAPFFFSRTVSAAEMAGGPPATLSSLNSRVTALEQQQKSRPVVVCGPSGVGKGTLLRRLIKDYPDDFGYSVSHTTRAPRAGEVNGVDYHFCEKAEMERMISEGAFIEYARVHANIYGTSIAAVRSVGDAGKTCLLEIDVQGADQVKKTDLDAKFVFIAPPSYDELEQRLRGRGTETEEKVALRLKNARDEMAYLEKKDYWDAIIVNDNVDVAYRELKAAVCVRPPES